MTTKEKDPHAGLSGTYIGQELRGGRYLLEKKVNQGGTAWLFKAVHMTLFEPVAIKLLYPQHLDNPTVRHRFLEEARIQYRLKHQNIVHTTDIIEEEFTLGSVMEWVEGEDLHAYLRRRQNPCRLDEISVLLGPIIEALAFVHRMGLVHRDIKPANILLANQFDTYIPKLADFGIAKTLYNDGNTATGSTLGTVTYMSPEQIQDAKNVTPLADIYSIGVVLYEMLTGQPPFTGPPQQQFVQHLSDPPPVPSTRNPSLSHEVDDFLLWCLQKDPAQRPDSCETLLTSLGELVGHAHRSPLLRFSTLPHVAQSAPLASPLNTQIDEALEPILSPPPRYAVATSSPPKTPIPQSSILSWDDNEEPPATKQPSIFHSSSLAQMEKTSPSASSSSLPASPNKVGRPRKTTLKQPPAPSSSSWKVLSLFLLVLLLGVSGVLAWSVWRKKRAASSVSNQLQSQPLIPAVTPRKKSPKYPKACFTINPADTYFFFKFNEEKRTERNAFCASLRQETKVTIWRNGYHDCEFALSARKANIELQLLPIHQKLETNATNYCLPNPSILPTRRAPSLP